MRTVSPCSAFISLGTNILVTEKDGERASVASHLSCQCFCFFVMNGIFNTKNNKDNAIHKDRQTNRQSDNPNLENFILDPQREC